MILRRLLSSIASQRHNSIPISAQQTHNWRQRALQLRSRGIDRWDPQKKLSREQMSQIREIQQMGWGAYEIAEHFGISAESVRRILRSRWNPSSDRASKQDNSKAERKAQIVGALRSDGLSENKHCEENRQKQKSADALSFGENSASARRQWDGIENQLKREAKAKQIRSAHLQRSGVRVFV